MLLLCGALQPGPAWAAKQDLAGVRGYVDPSTFVDLAGGPDAVRVEISIHKSLIGLICAGLDEDLKEVACGLEAINAVIIDLAGERVGRARELLADTERNLRGRGWERLALVREDDSEVRVLLLNDASTISGLVVMVLSHETGSGELVFANVAGRLDLAAMQRLGDELNIPGLDNLERLEREKR